MTVRTVSQAFSKVKKRLFHLAQKFVYVPMMLSHPFDEVVKLLDEVPDLQSRFSLTQVRRSTPDHIITAKVETLGPRKDQRERLSIKCVRTTCRREAVTRLT
jgi:hypothetical protein